MTLLASFFQLAQSGVETVTVSSYSPIIIAAIASLPGTITAAVAAQNAKRAPARILEEVAAMSAEVTATRTELHQHTESDACNFSQQREDHARLEGMVEGLASAK